MKEGFKVFRSTGCAACHLPEMVTANEGALLNGKSFSRAESSGE